jgi:DNA-binding transcriptional regulator YiaG
MDIKNLINRPLVALPDPAERKRLREAFQVTQKDLAAVIGVSRKTVVNWESGQWNPTGENRENYAMILTAWSEAEQDSQRKETQS